MPENITRPGEKKPANTGNTWDIFCRVIDNYGDIGVSYRLAKSLQALGQRVRLWVDDLAALKMLNQAVQLQAASQNLAGISVYAWRDELDWWLTSPADVVIEAFGCNLPQAYAKQIHQGHVWINLEYFTAEPWALGCHRLASPQKGLADKVFFFPGFAPLGGFAAAPTWSKEFARYAVDGEFWWRKNLPPPRHYAKVISLFAYENTALMPLLNAWAQGDEAVDIYLPPSKLCQSLTGELAQLCSGQSYAWGNLCVHRIPFLCQEDYDALLCLSDVNFVRGEESLARALLAGKPFVWHIYPTQDDAHWQKLTALEAYVAHDWPPTLLSIWQDFSHDWNAAQWQPQHHQAWWQSLAQMTHLTQEIQQALTLQPTLAQSLVEFVRQKQEVEGI